MEHSPASWTQSDDSGSKEGIGLRLQIVRREEQDDVAFVYQPLWNEKCERGREVETAELCLIDWMPQDTHTSSSKYLAKRGVGHSDLSMPLKRLHVFSFPSQQSEVRFPFVRLPLHDVDNPSSAMQERAGWWYIGAMDWEQVIIPPRIPTLKKKASSGEMV